MRCTACSTENPPLAKFCLECGAPQPRQCAGCGTALPGAAKFCLECGQAGRRCCRGDAEPASANDGDVSARDANDCPIVADAALLAERDAGRPRGAPGRAQAGHHPVRRRGRLDGDDPGSGRGGRPAPARRRRPADGGRRPPVRGDGQPADGRRPDGDVRGARSRTRTTPYGPASPRWRCWRPRAATPRRPAERTARRSRSGSG